MRKLSRHLYWIQESCNVVVVAADGAGLLSDFGTDASIASLEGAGVKRMERLFLTHFHRDRCSSASQWQERGAGLTFPFAEKRYFEEADILRASRDTRNSTTSCYPCFGPLSDLVGAEYARDTEQHSWRGVRFDVVPLPGHTFGSTGTLFETDGRRVLAW